MELKLLYSFHVSPRISSPDGNERFNTTNPTITISANLHLKILMNDFLTQYPELIIPTRILTYFLLAAVIAFLLRRLTPPLIQLGRHAPHGRKTSLERQKTLQSLVTSTINLIAFVSATLASMSLFIEPNTLAWVVGLFSTAFGFGARLIIGDYLGGLSFLFEDTFAVGEKIEISGSPTIEGVVEHINLRTTLLRSPSGELYIVPNGEIRSVRNFSRGKFSIANITLKIQSSDLSTARATLEALGDEAVTLLPDLIEPWKVTNLVGIIGQYTELTLIAKARFGKAAEMRPHLLSLVQERLLEVNIQLVS
ncbi:MAG: mechanosensitive ion channel family protein [Anaerolineales bacterium]|nr:mechanosensitive ion channel family protein [Anaerolineales bacterium]